MRAGAVEIKVGVVVVEATTAYHPPALRGWTKVSIQVVVMLIRVQVMVV